MIKGSVLFGLRGLAGLILGLWLASCAPSVVRPVQIHEYPLVEQSKDNPDHPGFQNWVPSPLIANHAEAKRSGQTQALIALVSGAGTIQSDSGVPAAALLPASLQVEGKSLDFIQQNGEFYLTVGGARQPYFYDQVVQNQSGSLSIFNPASNAHIAWFYALRDGLWYYVQVSSP